MDEKKISVYCASSVGIDYFFFLGKTIESAGYRTEYIFYVTEAEYRILAKSKGLKKFFLRLKMYILYPIQLIIAVFRAEKNSVFVVTSNTFYAPFICQLFSFIKNIKVVHLIYDLFPDALEIAGVLNARSFLSSYIGKITSISIQKGNAVVFLGDFLKLHAEKRWGQNKLSKIIEISTDLTLYQDFKYLPNMSKLVVHYGGQLGHLHDSLSIIESVKYILKSDISNKVEFNFYVSGAQADFLDRSLKDYPVKIISAVPSYQWRADIHNFHLGLVSLTPGGATVCIPSKTYGMMAGGMAILAICPQWSDLGEMVTKMESGWVLNNSKYDSLVQLHEGDYMCNIRESRPVEEIAKQFYSRLKYLIENPNELEQSRANAYNKVRDNYSLEKLQADWAQLLEEIK